MIVTTKVETIVTETTDLAEMTIIMTITHLDTVMTTTRDPEVVAIVMIDKEITIIRMKRESLSLKTDLRLYK